MATKKHHGPGVIVSRVDHQGRHYIGPLVARRNSGSGRGFVLWGVSPVEHYPGGSVFRVCAWPDSPQGGLRGWPTLREARAMAARINQGAETGFRCMGPFREHGLMHARGFDAWGRHFARAFRGMRECRAFLSAMARGDNHVARY